jgi:nucleotide-binding universal stress UspA family protein
MNKVVIAFDGTQLSQGAFELARILNQMQPILLTGVFVPQVNYANLWSYGTAMAGPGFIPLVEEEESEVIQKNIQQFEELCRQHNINHRVHKDFFDFALPELKKESRFADLLIISSEKFYENMAEDNNNEYMEDAIHHAECPVIVIPEVFELPRRNIIAYDGSSSSVYALKQFAYLFPEFCKNETLLLYVKDDKSGEIPSEEYITELATQHFPNLKIEKLQIKPKKFFTTWLAEAGNALLVSGSYAKSGFSSLFHKSFVSEAIGAHKLPVFIAHK